jgi:hypothetical protein
MRRDLMSSTHDDAPVGGVTTVEEKPRRDFAAGLRALADLLDAHPEQKQHYDSYRHLICVNTREEMLEATRALGGRWDKDEDRDSDYFGLTRDLGNGVTVYVYAPRRAVCERVRLGTRTVTRPIITADTPTETVEEELYEWVCPPSLLAAAGSES